MSFNKSLFGINYTVVFDVKFEQKDKAKAQRLRWNPSMKKWTGEIDCNGLTDQAIGELDMLPIKIFKVIDIHSKWFEEESEQKEILLKHCRRRHRKAQRENEESTQERDAELKWLAKRRAATVVATSHKTPIIDFV
jgi:hypothetical protein